MVIKILIKSALRSLQHHKGRSLLTMLGIIIGITSIIATLAIGYGTEEKIKKQIADMLSTGIDTAYETIYDMKKKLSAMEKELKSTKKA